MKPRTQSAAVVPLPIVQRSKHRSYNGAVFRRFAGHEFLRCAIRRKMTCHFTDVSDVQLAFTTKTHDGGTRFEQDWRCKSLHIASNDSTPFASCHSAFFARFASMAFDPLCLPYCTRAGNTTRLCRRPYAVWWKRFGRQFVWTGTLSHVCQFFFLLLKSDLCLGSGVGGGRGQGRARFDPIGPHPGMGEYVFNHLSLLCLMTPRCTDPISTNCARRNPVVRVVKARRFCKRAFHFILNTLKLYRRNGGWFRVGRNAGDGS